MKMKFCSISFVLGLIALQSILTPSTTIVNAQQTTDSCNSTLPLKDLTFDSSLLHCVDGWSPQNFILRYAKTAANTWSLVLSAPDNGNYIGIGFSTTGLMVGGSAVVGWIPSDGRGQAKQYALGGKSTSSVIPDQGDLTIVNGSLKIESVSSRLYMSFQLTAELPLENLLYALGPDGFMPSSPDFRLKGHQAKISTTIKYITEPATSGPQASPSSPASPDLTTTQPPPSTPSSAYGLSPSLLLFCMSLLALKFY